MTRLNLRIWAVLILLISPFSQSWADTPVISNIADGQTTQGASYRYTPSLSNTANAGIVNWTKSYGPDGVSIHPSDGTVQWDIPADLPTESFHISIKASNAQGYAIESWIVHVGVPKVVYIGPSETHQTIFNAFKDPNNQVPAMTFIVRNGTYSGQVNAIQRNNQNGVEQLPIEGSSALGYTTVMAEDPGQVVLTDAAATINLMSTNRSYGYVAIKGFFSKGGSIGSTGLPTYNNCDAVIACRPHHLKFILNGVESNGASPLSGFRSDYVLFENNYAFGGGRYKITGYQSTHMVYRRNVARYDRSNNAMAEPKGTYSMYSVLNFVTNNNIAIDGDQEQFVTLGSRPGEYTCPTTNAGAIGIFERNLQLNSQYKFGNIDYQRDLCDAEIRDVVAWDIRPLGILFQSRSPSWLNHATMGKIRSRSANALAEDYFNGWPSDFVRGVTNSTLHDFDSSNAANGMFFGFAKRSNVELEFDYSPFASYEYPLNAQEISNLGRTVDRFGVDHVNISESPSKLNSGGNSTVSNISNLPPLWARNANPSGGLRYLLRVEPNSNLSGQALDGGDLGATVMTFKGKSGTLWGEPGYNDETNIPMWPFPMEELVHQKMTEYRFTGPTYTGSPLNRVATGLTATINGTRGFAVPGQTLTHYIWSYLDNTAPPFNVRSVAGTGQALLKWDAPANVAGITNYTVYDYNATTHALSNPRSTGSDNTFYTVPNLTTAETYHFVVTATGPTLNGGESGGESSYSYPTSVTLSPTGPDVSAPSINNFSPSTNSNASPDSAISFNLIDIASGVDLSTLLVHVNGQLVSPQVSGSASNYHISYQAGAPYNQGEQVSVSISVDDFSDNRLSTSFGFTIATESQSFCFPLVTRNGAVATVCL